MDYSFQTLFDSLVIIGEPMHSANDGERELLDRVFERVRERMIAQLYREVSQ